MSDIIERTFVSGADKALTLDNREYARIMLIGTDWTKIRIGALIAITPNGTSNLTAVKFAIGACSGKTNPYSASSTTNWIGCFIGGTAPATGATWSYNANAGNPYYGSPGAAMGQTTRRVGTTLTGNSYGINGPILIPTNTGSVQRRWGIYVDITKGSPNYTVKLWADKTAPHTAEKTVSQFIIDLETASPAGYTGADSTLACDQTAGSFDAVSIFWNQTLYPLDLYDFRVYRFS